MIGSLSKLALAAGMVWLSSMAVRGDEVLSNQDVEALIEAKIDTKLVVRKIIASDNIFDVSAAAMVELRGNGVPDEVIDVMLAEYEKRKNRRQSRVSLQIQSLASDIPETRQSAYINLLRQGLAAQTQMQDALTNPAPEVRAAVINAFSRMDCPDMVPMIRIMLQDASAQVRLAAADYLLRFDRADTVREAMARITAWRFDRPGPSPDADIRITATDGQQEAIPFIRLMAAESDSENVRLEASRALGEIKDRDSRRILSRIMLQDQSPEVRLAAARSLASLGIVETIPALRKALIEDKDNRENLFQIMGIYPSKHIIPTLITLLAEDLSNQEQKALRDTLRRMTHQDFGLDVSKWLNWWELNEGEIREPQMGPELTEPANHVIVPPED
jgi:HEAT repeat protein